MASRVNLKFVVLLATVLVLAAGGTGFLAYKVVIKSPAELAARGDAKLDAGEIRAAELYYSKAVNKDPYNSVYLLKWRSALEQLVPDSDRELQTEFSNTYRQVLSQLALSDNMSHPEYQLEYLQLMYDWLEEQGFNRSVRESVANDATRYIDYHEAGTTDSGEIARLKRMRGMHLSSIVRQGLDLTPEQRTRVEADFAAALAAFPDDYEALESLTALYQQQLTQAEQAGRVTESRRLHEAILSSISSFAEANGDQSRAGILAAMLLTQRGLVEAAQAASDEFGERAAPEIEKIAARFQETTERLAAGLGALDPAEVDARTLRRLYALESQTNLAHDFRATMPLVRRGLDSRAEDISLALLLAEIHAARSEFDDAVAVLEPLLDAPPLPLGLAAWRRINGRLVATAGIADYSLRAQAAATDDATKGRWIDRARDARSRLALLIAEASPPVKLLDAKLAIADEDFGTAQKLLDEYNGATNNTNGEALWLTAEIAQRFGQPGKSRDALTLLLTLRPGQASTLTALAEVELSLNQPEAALEHLRNAQKSHPNDQQLKDRIAEIEMRLDPSKAPDPVTQALYEARRLAAGSKSEIADPAAGIERLSLAIAELGDDITLYREKARLQLVANDLESAAETIQAGLEHFPGDEKLTQYQQGIAGSNSVDARVEMILASADTDIEKYLGIFAAYSGADRAADAAGALAKAQAINPTYPRLLELRFNLASSKGDIDEARRVTDLATSSNADGINGLGYRARLLMLERRNEEALAALGQAVQLDANNIALWRLLGNLQLNLGRGLDAIASYQKAIALRPNDVPTILEYCGGLISLNRYDEALDVARRSESAARGNPRFMELLLGLEARVGDKEAARVRRERILSATPANLPNRFSLIDLDITLGRRDEAAELIRQTREQYGPSDSLVQLEARWFAEGNDIEAARRVLASDIAETPPAERAGKLLTMAQFMLAHGRSKSGLIALQQAVKYQPQGTHEIEILLASTLMRFSRNEEAYAILQKLLAEVPATEGAQIALQTAEALIGIDRLTDAEKLLATIPNAEADLTAVLLRSRIHIKRGDGRTARALLDDAVTRWPGDNRVWILRAEAEAIVPELRNDALADLEQAITLRPDLAEAHRRKAQLLAELGREDEAIAAWREAVRLNPTLEELRGALLTTMVQRGLTADSMQMADEWFALRPHDVGLRTRVAELFLAGGMFDTATQIYQDAFQIDQQPQVLLRLTDLLLGATPPRAAEAERAMSQAKTAVAGDPALLLARARIFVLTNRAQAAINDCNASFGIASKRAEYMAFWYTTFSGVFDDTQQTLAFLRALASQPGGQDWAPLFAARQLLADDATADAGLSEIRAVVSRTRDADVLYSALRALSGHLYNHKQFEEAIETWKRTLELRANDWQIENNIAYTLGTDLDRPEEALPYAESATKHAPNNPEVHDTLGAVYLALGQPAEALAPLEAAVAATRGTPLDAKYMTRLAQARLAAGDRQGAQDLVTQIQALLDRGRKLDDQYAAILQQVREDLH